MEQERAVKLQDDQTRYLTQVEIPVTTADSYFSLESRPSIVFVEPDPFVQTRNCDRSRTRLAGLLEILAGTYRPLFAGQGLQGLYHEAHNQEYDYSRDIVMSLYIDNTARLDEPLGFRRAIAPPKPDISGYEVQRATL
jgi:hypothetical protein